ncbi:alpha/beta fold hydrolase [Haloechinothrix halophila]|uniref:alpha/beta fold hydrolase n=1 Tax=Haloechinothrix halophila TaxID=1069073 RepID=UPI0012F875AF|nr:alpha/beta hydrolase [Haloechinothrix halophila]
MKSNVVSDGVVLNSHGPQERPYRMLLLHGLANSASVWENYLAQVPATHCALTAELPWRAETIVSFASSYDHTIDAVKAALRGLDGLADVVVAHSFAANLLMAMVDHELRHGRNPMPQYGIKQIVLVSPFYRRQAHDFTWRDMSYFFNGFHLIMEEGLRVASRGRVADDVLLDMAYRVRDRVGPYGWTAFFDTYLRTPWLLLDRVDVPCLVVTGEDDIAAPPAEAMALARELPDARLEVLPDCGHFPMAASPTAFAAAVAGFLGELDPMPAAELETNL